MNAYEYGNQHFGKLYQPKPNVVVFNDKITVIDDIDTPEGTQDVSNEGVSDFFYLEAKKLNDNHYLYYNPQEPGRLLSESYVEGYLIPNGYFVGLGTDNVVNHTEQTNHQVYAYGDKYYIKYRNPEADTFGYTDYNNEVIITGTKSKFMAFTDQKLEDLLNNPELKLILFFAHDGVKIETAYQSITDIKPDELVLFLEKDDSYNVLGSVVRIRSGNKISAFTLPVKSIYRIADFFSVDISKKETEELLKMHLEDKKNDEDKNFVYYVSKAFKNIIRVGRFALSSIGEVIEELGNTISSFVFDDMRWKYYSDDGTVSQNFAPIFPGLKQKTEGLENAEQENQTKSFETSIENLDVNINSFLKGHKDMPKPITGFLQTKFGFIKTLSSKLKRLYQTFKKTYTEKNALIFINALFVGLVNSIMKAIGGIISLIGLILKLPYLYETMDKNKARSTVSATFELLENFTETTVALLSKNIDNIFRTFKEMGRIIEDTLSNPENVKTLIKEFSAKALDKADDLVNKVGVNADKVGYGLGFAVGFIIEEVVTAIYSGGAKNIVSALKFAKDSYVDLFKLSASFGKRVVKRTINSPIDAIQAIGALIKRLRKVNIKQKLEAFLVEFKKWFTTTKQLAEEAYKRLFSKNEQKAFNLIGFKPTKYIDDILTLCPIGK